MRNLFKSKIRVTQVFAADPAYYKQFGLKGHEGLDVVPTGTVWDVLCLEDGVVVRDIDDATLGKNYGKNVTVWHPNVKKATQYCHLAENNVSMGQRLTKGDKLGVMGKTGNVTGAHVHLNLFEVDDNGIRLNRENGYFGGIDPLPFLEEDTQSTNTDPQAELNKLRQERDNNWNAFVALCDALQVPHMVDVAVLEIKKLIGTEDTLLDKQKKLEDAMTKIGDLEAKIHQYAQVNEEVLTENQNLKKKVDEQMDTITKQGFNIGTLQENLNDLKKMTGLPTFTGFKKFIFDLLIK